MILADTGFFVALANPRDRWHAVATDTARGLVRPLVTTWPVLTETCHLLVNRLGPHAQERFVESIAAGAALVHALDASDLARAHVLMAKYRSLPMDLADASLVLLAEHLGRGDILSTDTRDFRSYRWKTRKPFRNLLREP
jgi:predicted nucleic acid-binding protein